MNMISSAATVFQNNKVWADRAIVQVPDDKLHLPLDANTNSIAVIMKHVAGNLLSRWTDFLTTDGEKPWRDRDDEFVDTFTSRAEVLDYWEKGWGRLFETLDGLEAEDLGKTVSIRGEPHSVPLAIHRSLSHCAYHVGQIIMVARILAGENWERITIARGQSTAYNEQVWDKGHFSMVQDETNESRENDRAAVQECEENTYRWNVTAAASGYDLAAEHVHPHYVEIQDVILDALPFDRDDAFTVVDAGGGSGRLVERILDRFLIARGLIIDQSEAFLALAERRLSRFGSRAACHHVRLQDDWPARINADIHAIVSMSAIHHLDADEKREFYGRGFRSLAGGGLLINGDEVRPPGAAAYLSELRAWAGHMRRLIADGLGSSRK